jgi:hypothetical protein
MSDPSVLASVGPRLAAPFLTLLPVAGVAISVFDQERRASVLHTSDMTAARLEEVQFDVGEGPMFDCYRTARAVLVPDLAVADEWPAFLSYTDDIAAASLFVFPITLGAAAIGAVLCYTSATISFDDDSVRVGSALARAIAGPAFRYAITLADNETPDGGDPIEVRREVHQATGMILLQLGVSPTDAFARMRAHAFTSGRSLREIAHDVVTRELDFTNV